MSEINKPPFGGLDTSPPKTATQHSHTSNSDHETASIKEGETGGNPEPMMMDELVEMEIILKTIYTMLKEQSIPRGKVATSKIWLWRKRTKATRSQSLAMMKDLKRGMLIQANGRLRTKLLSLQLLQLFRRAEFRQVVLGAFLQKDWLF